MKELLILLLNEGVPTAKILKAAKQHQVDFRYMLQDTTCLVSISPEEEAMQAFEYKFTPNRTQLWALAQGKNLFYVDGFVPSNQAIA